MAHANVGRVISNEDWSAIMKRFVIGLAGLAVLTGAAGEINAGIIYPVNNGFEVPNLGASTFFAFAYRPAAPGWTFTGSTGIAANGSGFTVVGATNGNHDGTTSTSGQAAFIQAFAGSGFTSNFISQSLSGFSSGFASVTFSIEQRTTIGNNPIDVKLDSQDLGTYLASSSSSFNTITTPLVAVTAGSHTLYFISTNNAGVDVTQFIDNVSVTNNVAGAVPEPASLTLFGLASMSLLGYGWRRRKAAA